MANLDITKNFAKSTVSTGYTSSATEIILVPGGGSVFPDPAVSGAFNLIWWDRSTFIDPFDDPKKEIVRCTAISWDTLTITRAQEGTLATNKNTIGSWYDIALVLTKKTIDDIGTELDAKLENITSESIGDLNDVDLTGVSNGKTLLYNGTSEKFEVSETGTGDMTKSVYDPEGVEGDSFDMDNMAQGTTNKFVGADELAVLQATSGTNTGDQESSDFDIKDLTDSTDLRTTWSGKQDAIIAGTDYEVPLTFSTGLTRAVNTITCDITQYADADAIAAIKGDADWKNTDWDSAYLWGDHSLVGYVTGTPWTLEGYLTGITGESIADLSDVDSISGATNGKILKWNTNKFVLADDENTTYTSSDFDIKDLADSTDLMTTWSAKQDALTFGIADTNAVKIDSASVADDEFARFTANGLESRSASEVRGDLGLATSDIPQFTGIELGNASDTTITRSAAGVIAVENVNLAKSTMGEDLTTNNFNILRKSIPSADNRGEGDIITDIVAGETLSFPNLVYLKSDGKWWKADADAIASCDLLGLALESKNANEAVKVLVNGFVRDDDWAWTVGGKVYASTTPAALSQTAVSGEDDVVAIIGYATHSDRLYFRPDNTRIEFKA